MLKEMERERVPMMRMQQILGIRSSWMWRNLVNESRKVTEKEAEDFLLAIFYYQLTARQGASEAELKDVLLKYCMKRRDDR